MKKNRINNIKLIEESPNTVSLNASTLEVSLLKDLDRFLTSPPFKYYNIYRKKNELIDLYKHFISKYVLVLNQKEELKKNHVKKDAILKGLVEELQELKDILIKKDDLIKQLVLENDSLKQSLKANYSHLPSLQEISNAQILNNPNLQTEVNITSSTNLDIIQHETKFKNLE